MSEKLIRKSLIELETLDRKEVVRVAGVVRRLKNFFKQQFNPEYKESVNKLKTENSDLKELSEKLTHQLNALQSAVKDGEIEEYQNILVEIKELTKQFWLKLKLSEKTGKDWYDLQQYQEPGFNEWFKAQLPEDYKLDLNKRLDVNFQESDWHKNLKSEDVTINPGAAMLFFRKLKDGLVTRGFTDSITADKYVNSLNKELVLNNFKNAIVNGTIVEVQAKKPSKVITKQQIGITELNITTSPFAISDGVNVQAKVIVIDATTAQNSRHKLSLRLTTYVTPLGQPKLSTRKDELLKLALSQEVPYQQTTVSDVEFAEIMKKGYEAVFGDEPTAEALAGGWAQAVLESGRPIKLPNNNVGNIKATKEWVAAGNPYFVKSTSEYTHDGKPFTDENAKWRAFRTPEEGAAAYWRFIGKNYKNAMDWMAAGDPHSASVSLGLNHYFTADIQKYSSGVGKLYQEFMTKIAPQIPGLQSSPKPAPGIKPEIKQWSSQYTKEEHDSLHNQTAPANSTDVDGLINSLYACGPLEKMVKTAILKEKLPNSQLLILVKGDDRVEKLEFARIASDILRKFVQANVSIHSDNNEIELNCSVLGNPFTASRSIQALCDVLSETMRVKTSSIVESIVVAGFKSNKSIIDWNEIDVNSRHFKLKRFI